MQFLQRNRENIKYWLVLYFSLAKENNVFFLKTRLVRLGSAIQALGASKKAYTIAYSLHIGEAIKCFIV